VARRFATVGTSRIVYDSALVNPVDESLFDPDAWPDALVAPEYSGGRGKTLFISKGEHDWVLRHYHRGGLVGRWLNDTYFWVGDSQTRPFREWLLLERLVEMGLPVPRPVAGCFVRRGAVYTADLITVRIPSTVPFSHRWIAGALEPDAWRRVGELVGRFHGSRVYHADLNAHNIQIDDHDDLFLLDFDRGRIMPGAGAWMERNLDRLRRSLQKIGQTNDFALKDQDWNRLLNGYRRTLKARVQ